MTHTMRTVATALSLSLLSGLPVVLAQTGTPARPAATAAALSSVVTTVTPELMLATLQTAGYAVKLDKSGDNPEITLSRKNSVDVYLNFHNCKTGSCTELDVYTYYSADDLKTEPGQKEMAAWNNKHYTQAYIDADDDDSVNLDSLYRFTGGFTRANFLNWLNEFLKDADSFDRMIDSL